MAKKYHVKLNESERKQLHGLLARGKLSVRKVKRAQILLAAASGAVDQEIAALVQVHVNTVERIRKRFVEGHGTRPDRKPATRRKITGWQR
jgi:transposase